jgi:hypothetical protein
MPLRATLLAVSLVASPSPQATPASPPPASPTTEAPGPVILFLIDNSASLPPLDPDEKRVAALEKMFTFLKGQPYRLVLFAGRRETSVDDVTKYSNHGQWTDFYAAFEQARELMKGYPAKTEFRLVLLTDALPDPDPQDWKDVPEAPKTGEALRAFVTGRTLDLIGELKTPLYVILVGDVPKDAVPGDREQAPQLVLDMVLAANGAKASPTAQRLAAFFKDDGILLRKFVYRVAPNEGLKKVEPVIRRVIAPTRPVAELQFLTFLLLPMSLFLLLLLGLLVRSFPGPGDLEIVELALGSPVHLAADRLHKVSAGGWGTTGLSLVASAKEASASVTYQVPSVDLAGAGLDTEGLDALTLALLPLDPEPLQRALERYSDEGAKDEKIYALNLDYMAKNFDPKEAERILTSSPAERRRIPALDFLRAKVHLLSNESLRRKLTEPRVQLTAYGKDAERKELPPGAIARIGRYGFLVKDVARGGRKDVRLVLYYDRVPSLLGLKTILPDIFQRVFRLRRSSQRIVS